MKASGNPARWNSKDVNIIYSASSRSLACLENIVHRSGVGMQQQFRTMIIEIPENVNKLVFDKKDLPDNWQEFSKYPETQKFGDNWIQAGETVVLQVPSAIIPEEFNYLINPAHKDFKHLKLLRTEPFEFDTRIKK